MNTGLYEYENCLVCITPWDTDFFQYRVIRNSQEIAKATRFTKAVDAYDAATAMIRIIARNTKEYSAFIHSPEAISRISESLRYCHTEDACEVVVHSLFPEWVHEYWRMVDWNITVKEYEIVASITVERR